MAKSKSGFFKGILGVKETNVRPTKTEGVPGTAIYGGYIVENEKNASLSGTLKYTTYSDLLANVSIIAAGTRFFLNLISRSKWVVEPADDSAKAQELAEWLENAMESMDTPWHRVVRRAAMYRFYGFSIQEWTAKRLEDGSIGMQDVAPRPQQTIIQWDRDDQGKIIGVVQESPQDYEQIYLNRKKLVYMVDDTLNDSPEGLGLFRHVVKTSQELLRFEQLEGFGYEADLRGIPVGRAPVGELSTLVEEGAITEEQKAAILSPLETFIGNHIKNPRLGLVLDSSPYRSQDEGNSPSSNQQWDIELLQSSASSAAEVSEAIARKNQEIARVLGVEGLLLGSTQHGSQALSTDKSHNFALIVSSTLGELSETFEKDYTDVLWKLNGFDPELKPKFKTESSVYRDVTQITTALRDMATAGAILAPDDPAINEVRELLGLSDAELDSLFDMEDATLRSSTTTTTATTETDEVDPDQLEE